MTTVLRRKALLVTAPVLLRSNCRRELPPLESVLRAETQLTLVERLRFRVSHRFLREDQASKHRQEVQPNDRYQA